MEEYTNNVKKTLKFLVLNSLVVPIDIYKTNKQAGFKVHKDYFKISNILKIFSINAVSTLVFKVSKLGIYNYLNSLNPDNITSSTVAINTLLSTSAVLLLSNPLWYYHTMRELNSNISIYEFIKKNKFNIFIRGLPASLISIPEAMIFMMYYEKYISKEIKDGLQSGNTFKPLIHLSAAKLISTFVFYPHEVMRTYLRSEDNRNIKSLISDLSKLNMQNKIKMLYRGILFKGIITNYQTLILYYFFELLRK